MNVKHYIFAAAVVMCNLTDTILEEILHVHVDRFLRKQTFLLYQKFI